MAEAVVDLLEVVDVRDHERHARPVPVRVLQLVLQALGQLATVGETGQGVGLRLAAQAGDVVDDLRDRTREARGECCRQRERHDRREEDEAPISRRGCVDGRDRLDRACLAFHIVGLADLQLPGDSIRDCVADRA